MSQFTKIINGNTVKGFKGTGFPLQTITVAEKEKDEFKIGCMDFMANEARRQSRDKANDIKKYKFLSSDYDYPKNTWSADPLNLGDKKEELYGATDSIQHYPIMNSPLNTIWGERINRPMQFYCLSESPASFNEYNRQKTELLLDHVTTEIQQRALMRAVGRAKQSGMQIDEQIMQQLQQEAQTMSAPAIQRYMDKDYVDVIEQSANRMMRNLWKKNNIDDEFIEGFRNGTISGKERYFIHVMNNNISIKNLNPFTVFEHKSPSCRWISEGQYAGYRLFLTPSSVIDMKRDSLTTDDIEAIEEKIYPNTRSQGINSLTGIKSISYDTQTFADQYGTTFRELNNDIVDQMINEFQLTGVSTFNTTTAGLIEYIQAYWKSYRKLGFLHYYNEADEEVIEQVDENYKPNEEKGEWVKWQYINQVYEGTRIDEDIYVDVQPYPHQIFDFNNPDFAPLPIEGANYTEFNGRIVSLTDLMMPWNELYDIIAYELKRDMKKAIGKAMFMSIDHIPNLPGFTEEKWMFWLKEFGIAWVGEGKKRSQFSHYSAQDMSFAEQMLAKMNMLDRIKFNCDSFGGFSQPRLANTSNEETAKQSQMSIASSVNQTEYYFWKHSQIIQRVLTIALNIGKKLITEGKGFMRNLYDDMEQRYLETDAATISNADLNLFVVHGSQTINRREAVRQMAMAAAGKTGEAFDMADIIMANTENEIKQMMRELRRKQEVKAKQQQDHETQIAQMDADQQEKDRAWEKEKHYSTLESEERQEYIRSFINQKDNLKDTDENGMADILEGARVIEEQADNLRKHQRELRKQEDTTKLKEKELAIKQKEVKVKADKNQVDLKNQKNDLEIARQNARGRQKSGS